MGLSQADFNRLIDAHGAVLYRTAFRLVGNRQDAEDVVQETFRSVWLSRDRFRPELGERAWMVAILRRRIADRYRRRRLPELLGADMESARAVDDVDPVGQGYTDEMQRALGRLPKELRETLLLVVVGELTHQEAADLMEMPLGTVLSRVSRARARLREYLIQEREKKPKEGNPERILGPVQERIPVSPERL